MDGYSRKMLKLVFCAFCLMIPAVLRVNSNFNTIVQPPINSRIELPELATFQHLKTELARNGKEARDKALTWLAQVREGKWDSIASKKH